MTEFIVISGDVDLSHFIVSYTSKEELEDYLTDLISHHDTIQMNMEDNPGTDDYIGYIDYMIPIGDKSFPLYRLIESFEVIPLSQYLKSIRIIL